MINYKEEVLKIFPNATLFPRITDKGHSLLCDSGDIGANIIGSCAPSLEPENAWKNAYERFIRHGKL